MEVMWFSWNFLGVSSNVFGPVPSAFPTDKAGCFEGAVHLSRIYIGLMWGLEGFTQKFSIPSTMMAGMAAWTMRISWPSGSHASTSGILTGT